MALPLTIEGFNTAIAGAGPFAFGPDEVTQTPFGITSAGYEGFGEGAVSEGAGFAFTTVTANSIVSVKLALNKVGSPSDNLVCKLYATSGGLPTGAALGTSANVAGSTLSTGAGGSYITFTFASPVAVSSGVTYAAFVTRTGSTDVNHYYQSVVSVEPVAIRESIYKNVGGAYAVSSGWYPDFVVTTNGTMKYFFFPRSATVTTLMAFKSTDTATAWASVATKTGFTTGLNVIKAKRKDNIVHLAVLDGTVSSSLACKYVNFDMASETFLATTETVSAAASVTGTATAGWGCDLCVRPNGNIVFVYNSVTVSSRARISYRERTGLNTYGAAVRLDDNALANNTQPACVLGAGGRVHCMWISDAANKFRQRTLNAANALQTEGNLGATVATCWGGAVSYDEAGAVRVVVGGNFGVRFASGDVPTLTAAATNVDPGFTRRVYVDAGDSNKVHYTYVNGSTFDVHWYYSTDDGATFTPSATGTAHYVGLVNQGVASITNNSGEVYKVGSNWVVGYILNDSGIIKYNEVTVRLGPVHYVMPAATGTVAVSGQAATLIGAEKVLIAATGTIAASGQAVGLRATRTVVAGLGTSGLDGKDVGLARTWRVPANTGTVVLSGRAVTLTKSGLELWTPAHLTVVPRVLFDPHEVPWSGSSFATTTHTGSFGGNIVASQGTVSKGTALNGYEVAAFSGSGQSLKLSGTNDWTGDAAVFAVVRANQGAALVGMSWGQVPNPATAGWVQYPRGGGAGSGGGHSWAVNDTIVFGSGNNALVNHTYATMIGSNAPFIYYVTSGAVANVRGNGSVETESGRSINGASNSFTGQTVYIGSSLAAGEYYSGDIAYLLVTTAADLTADEIERLEGWAAHKYGLTANLPSDHPYKTDPPTTAPAVTHYTMPAGTGTIALSGVVARSAADRRLVAAQATVALAGQTATLKRGLKVAAGLGTITLSGRAATLARSRDMDAGLGTLTMSGQTTVLHYAHKMPVALGVLTAEGRAATLTYSRKIKMVAGTGVVALSGVIANLVYTTKTHYVMSAFHGVLTAEGRPTTLTYVRKLRMAAEVGTVALAGQATTLRAARRVAAGLGTLALSGRVAVLRRSRLPLVAGLGTIALSGRDAMLRFGHKLPVTHGTITAEGRPTVLRATRHVVAAQGTIQLSGQAVTLRYSADLNHPMLAGLGTVAWSGQTVTLRYARKMPAALGTLTLSGQTAGVRRAKRMAAAQGTLALSGRDALLRYGYKMPVTHGTVLFDGRTVALRTAKRAVAQTTTILLSGEAAQLDVAGLFAGVNVWNGTEWEEKPAKVWTGSVWTAKPVKHWNGSAWI